ncbi:MAG: hypothetical protein LBB50_03090 [Oscillospiraceae bacterium]|jgi:hypothetical protein|nr:hypothetical protein [Oscillospiraceae bacterium]
MDEKKHWPESAGAQEAVVATAAAGQLFYATCAEVYFICKIVFASGDAILAAMQAYYLGRLRAPKGLALEADAQRTQLFNLCKARLQEETSGLFAVEGADFQDATCFAEGCKAEADTLTTLPKATEDATRKWLTALSPVQRLLSLMHFDPGFALPVAKIAQVLRVPEEFVAARLWAAAAHAQTVLGKAEAQPYQAACLLGTQLQALKAKAQLSQQVQEILLLEIQTEAVKEVPATEMPWEAEAGAEEEFVRFDFRYALHAACAAALVVVTAACVFGAVGMGKNRHSAPDSTITAPFDFDYKTLPDVVGFRKTQVIKVPTTVAEPEAFAVQPVQPVFVLPPVTVPQADSTAVPSAKPTATSSQTARPEPTTAVSATDSSVATEPPATESPTTEPPATEPPATELPVTEPSTTTKYAYTNQNSGS